LKISSRGGTDPRPSNRGHNPVDRDGRRADVARQRIAISTSAIDM
jgi:hypothetical protein